MGGWWITDLLNDPNINGRVSVVSWAVWVIFSICLHELAHGWTAIKLGDDTPRLSGHMTWNPLAHMGSWSLIVFVFFGIAWGMMPVNPSRLRGRYADAVVALAGPMMNLVLAILALIGLMIWKPLSQGELISTLTIAHPLSTNMETFLFLGAKLNIVLLFFNLLPIAPLDGGRILMDLSSKYRQMMMTENGRWVVLGVFVLFFVFAGPLMFLFADIMVDGLSTLVWSIFFPNMST